MTDFENALITFCEEDAANIHALRKLRAEAFGKITGGGGVLTSLLSGSLNGKSYTQSISQDAGTLFTTLTRVLKAVDGTGVETMRCSTMSFMNIEK